MSGGALECLKDRGKLFGDGEEPAVGRRLLIAQSVDETAGCEASSGDAGGEPRLVDFREEAAYLIPTGALARFAGIAYEHYEEIESVAGGVHHTVGPRTDHVAEGGQKLEENSGGMRLGVASDGADGESGVAMERGHVEAGRS